jgi:1-aminocyclopropane-1-carboxylate synthase
VTNGDLASSANMLYVNFQNTSPFGLEAVDAYEQKLLEARAKGINVRILLLCNPHNPLGVCYTPEVLKAHVRLCVKYSLQLVSDEVYALSIFNTAPDGEEDGKPGFTSVLSVDSEAEGLSKEYVHILYGMSKDFAAGGLRLGCVHTRSKDLRRALFGIS